MKIDQERYIVDFSQQVYAVIGQIFRNSFQSTQFISGQNYFIQTENYNDNFIRSIFWGIENCFSTFLLIILSLFGKIPAKMFLSWKVKA